MKFFLLLILTLLTSCQKEEKPDFLNRYNVGMPFNDFRSDHSELNLVKGNACNPKHIKEENCKSYWTGPTGINTYWGRIQADVHTKNNDEISFLQVVYQRTSKGFSSYANEIFKNKILKATGGVKPHFIYEWEQQPLSGYKQYSAVWDYKDFHALAFSLCKVIGNKPQRLRDCGLVGYRVVDKPLKGDRLKKKDNSW